MSNNTGAGQIPVQKRLVRTLIGVLLMATSMATFNKYLVYGEFSAKLFQQVLVALLQKGPVAFILQFFFVQKFIVKQLEKYPTDNMLWYRCMRVGYNVLIMCPIMCLYSNIINMINFHWTFGQLIENWITKMPINWIFAFCVQVWILQPLTQIIYDFIFPKK